MINLIYSKAVISLIQYFVKYNDIIKISNNNNDNNAQKFKMNDKYMKKF